MTLNLINYHQTIGTLQFEGDRDRDRERLKEEATDMTGSRLSSRLEMGVFYIRSWRQDARDKGGNAREK